RIVSPGVTGRFFLDVKDIVPSVTIEALPFFPPPHTRRQGTAPPVVRDLSSSRLKLLARLNSLVKGRTLNPTVMDPIYLYH
ncbi:unnamed protein product, partial [Musa acuminata var. zebrina]